MKMAVKRKGRGKEDDKGTPDSSESDGRGKPPPVFGLTDVVVIAFSPELS
jgi:hypothetical protein